MLDVKSSVEPRRGSLRLAGRGDRELWVLDDADGSWSIPMFVDWKVEKTTNEEYAMMYPAISPYPIQHIALKARLQSYSVIASEERWLLQKETCVRLLRKAPGITPRYYYKWPDPNFKPIPVSSPMRIDRDLGYAAGSWEFDDFVKYISEKYSLPLVMIRVFWRAICEEVPHWMMASGRALDMGFCRMAAVPFRINWKEIVRCKLWKSKLAGIFNLPAREQRQALAEIHMPEVLCSPHNIGLLRQSHRGSNSRLSYTIEAIPTEKFERAANICEARRLACGSKSYVANFEKTVEEQYDIILAALANYIRKATLPFARVCENRHSGNLRFLPTKRPEKLSGVDPRHIPVSIVAPDTAFSVLGEKGEQHLIPGSAATLPKVPTLQPPDENLRQPNGGEPGRVPLLDAGEGGAGAESVLPLSETGTGSQPGVASGNEWEMNEQRNTTAGPTGAAASDRGPDCESASCAPAAHAVRKAEVETEAGPGGGATDGAAGPEGHQGQNPSIAEGG